MYFCLVQTKEAFSDVVRFPSQLPIALYRYQVDDGGCSLKRRMKTVV